MRTHIGLNIFYLSHKGYLGQLNDSIDQQAGAELSQAQVSYTLKSLAGSLAVLFSNGLKLLFVDQMKLTEAKCPSSVN